MHSSFIFNCDGPSLLWGLLSSCGAWLLLAVASVLTEHGLQCMWASAVVAHRLFPHDMCNLPRPRIESISPAVAGGFFTAGQSERSLIIVSPPLTPPQ